jgi:hypothetical protein
VLVFICGGGPPFFGIFLLYSIIGEGGVFLLYFSLWLLCMIYFAIVFYQSISISGNLTYP